MFGAPPTFAVLWRRLPLDQIQLSFCDHEFHAISGLQTSLHRSLLAVSHRLSFQNVVARHLRVGTVLNVGISPRARHLSPPDGLDLGRYNAERKGHNAEPERLV